MLDTVSCTPSLMPPPLAPPSTAREEMRLLGEPAGALMLLTCSQGEPEQEQEPQPPKAPALLQPVVLLASMA
jgi:hypothetical protein